MAGSMYNFGGYDPYSGYGGYNPYQGAMGGYGGYGGGYGGYGGGYGQAMMMPQYQGYNPYQGWGGGGYGGWGGGYGGYDQGYGQSQEFDFQGMFDQLFSKYFPQQAATEAPATEAPATTPAVTGSGPATQPETPGANAGAVVDATPASPYGANFGKGYAKTGKFGAKGKAAIKAAGYENVKEFKAANPTFRADYNTNHPAPGSEVNANQVGQTGAGSRPKPAPIPYK